MVVQRATARLRINLENTSQMMNPLFHPKQTESPRSPRVEAGTVILYREFNPSSDRCRCNLRCAGLRVSHHVVQSFLYHPINACLVFFR